MVSSIKHPFVKHLVKLRTNRKYRQEKKSVLVVGSKLIHDLSQKVLFQSLIVEKNYPIPSFLSYENLVEVTSSLLKKITGVEHPEPIAAVCALPQENQLKGKRFLIALDGISDPGNVGTLLRTALGLGWEGAFFLPSSCDPFNDKALRAAKGATFRLPLRNGTEEELKDLIEENQMKPYLADVKGPPLNEVKWQPPLLLILGHESKGGSSFAKSIATPIGIPMSSQMQSLNVSIAAAIMMYQCKMQIEERP
jgi:RNA methyltransferase, TrmH family